MNESSVAIANYFIRKGLDEDTPVTAMQVLKLVYIAHGWHLAITKGHPLISDQVEAWKYGPVIPTLYHEIKVFRGEPCSSLLSLFDGAGRKFRYPMVQDSGVGRLLDWVWERYGSKSGNYLSSLTHLPGTPWEKIWCQEGGSVKKGAVIPDELIEEHYSKRLPKPKAE